MPPLSLYVHLPWCVAKCPYCDFNSFAGGDQKQRSIYLDALTVDLRREAQRAAGRELVSVFLGGGTPSLFTPDEIAALLAAVGDAYALADDVEVTMEANPGSVECGDPAGYRDAGVNRLSIGAQSFSADALERLGRIHSTDDIERVFAEARDSGFDNINLDVMYALPGQTPVDATKDLQRAIELEPEHISWYQLTLEPNTVFHARPPAGLPDAEAAWDIQEAGASVLTAAGYTQYEVSAWARDDGHDRRSRHNMNYWLFGDYLAVGAGAHGKVTSAGSISRYRKPANPKAYVDFVHSGAHEAGEPVTGESLLFEYLLNALRLLDGFEETAFERRTGIARETLSKRMESVLEKGLIERIKGGVWRPTELGRRFLNDLQAEFLP